MSHRYNLHPGLFGLCSGYWDEKSQHFIRSDDVKRVDCCLRTCKPFMDECVEQCKKNPFDKSCYKVCDGIREICEENCQLSGNLWGINNPLYKSTKEFGCGDGIYKAFDIECVKENKDDIIKGCQDNCLPTMAVDCTHHCLYTYDLITDKKTNPLHFNIPVKTVNTVKTVENVKRKKGDNNTIQYFVYALAVVGIIFGLYILWFRNG